MSKSEQNSPPGSNGNAIGLGETFKINLSTGQGTYTYQIPLPDGVCKHTPKLSLEYAQGFGHSAWGLGWRINFRSIGMRLDFGTPDQEQIVRYMDNGAEIMPIEDGSYRALRESAFSRYTRSGNGWKIEDRNGIVHLLGISPQAQIAPPGEPTRVMEWLLESSKDVSGNEIKYTYQIDEGFAYPKTINYAIYEIRFHYSSRSDIRHDGRAGFSRMRRLLCTKLELVLNPGQIGERVIRSWVFGYKIAPISAVSLLATINLTSHGIAPDGSEDVHRPIVTFDYSTFDPMAYRIQLMTGEGGLPPALSESDIALVTLDNAPLPGILMNRNGREYYWRNQGNGRWASPYPLRQAPLATSFSRSGLAFVDMDGSGTADLMVAEKDTVQGYYENEGLEGWKNFVAFPKSRKATPEWTNANLRLMDADGDGLIDAIKTQSRAIVWWRNQSRQGWADPVLIPTTSADLNGIDLSDPDVFLADMTGDGMLDLVRVHSGRVEYWPNQGKAKFGDRVLMQKAPRLRKNGSIAQLLSDIDGDGCADLIVFSGDQITIYPNQNGIQFGPPIVISSIPPPLASTVRAINMNGNTGSGLVWNSLTSRGEPYVQFEFASTQPPYVLNHLNNGTGLQLDIQYRSAIEDFHRDRNAGILWSTNFPFPYLVVGKTKETDAISGRVSEVEFKYHEAHFEKHNRQFQGFRKTERIEKGDSSRADTLQLHHFLMAQEKQPGNGPEHAALNGLLVEVESYSPDGSPLEKKPFRVETSTYGFKVLNQAPDGRKRCFAFVTSHQVEDTERSDDKRVELKTYTFDTLGNVLKETHRGFGMKAKVAQTERVRITEVNYTASTTNYFVGKTARVCTRGSDGSLLTEKRLFYDGPDFTGLPLGQATKGLLTREEEWVMTRANFDLHYTGMNMAQLGFVAGTNADGIASVFATTQRNSYNAKGLPVISKDAMGNETHFTYDGTGLFRLKLADTLGETAFLYDLATVQITKTTYPDGTSTEFKYDAQGRLLCSALPGQSLNNPSVVYDYVENVIPSRRIARFRQANNVFSRGITYYDGSGKEFQQRVEVEPGKVVVSGLKRYNAWGDLVEEFEPVFEPATAFSLPDTTGKKSRKFFYDGLGRAVRTINYNGGVSTINIEAFAVETYDANDNDNTPDNIARGQFNTPHREEFDVLRYLLRVIEKVSPAKQVITQYQTGAMGELLQITDSMGSKMTYRYDQRGSRIGITIRESGERKIWYDARKKPIQSQDGAGHAIKASFDSAGRLLKLMDGDSVIEEYLYDNLAQNAFGRVAQITYPGGRQDFQYNNAGQLLERTYRYKGEATTHSLRYEYDTLGREIALIHSDGTRIEHQLMFNGWVKAIPNVVQDIQYDARGLPTAILYKNNVKTTYRYTAGPGKISRQITSGPGNVLLEDVSFSFDKMGILLSSNDVAPNGAGIRSYAYDPLSQLMSVTAVENGNPVKRNYDYAPVYNLRKFEEASVTLHYDDVSHPDRLSGLTPDGGALFNVNYDGNGNLLNLPGQQLEYNIKNELVRFQKGALVAIYAYDHQGFRISKQVDDGIGHLNTTLYVGDKAEIKNGTPVYFVRFGPTRLAAMSGGIIHFLHENSTGSTTFVTDASGNRVGRIDSRPFGNTASQQGNTAYRSFSLHPVDEESGFVYMRRRYYSPQLGRFLTPDLLAIYQPDKFLHAPQGLHLYSFVANDPLNKMDPTGLSWWSFFGSVVGVIVGIVVAIAIVIAVVATGGIAGVLLGIGLALGASLLVTGVSYAIASNVDPNSAGGQFLRGFMIGFNAGMNGVLASAIFGPVVGIALGVINFLATFEDIARSPVYQGILGWSSWLMPMSWGMTVPGLVIYAFNLVMAGITFQQWDAAKIEKLDFDWKTGSFVIVGGLVRNGTGFNLGNFVFIDPAAIVPGDPIWDYEAILRHETGHTLNVAAFGTAFQVGDFFGEVVAKRGENDYGELFAESHVGGSGRPTLPMWG
jgi:RHS repeat-associated protein